MRPLRDSSELTCLELVQLVTDYLEGALSSRNRRRFERHLNACKDCPTYVQQMRETIRLTGVLRQDDLQPEVREELLAAFRDWKNR
ncbi:MAG: zf-HC2 domain-containing protein [Actinomycetota bacterium]|nr:zf-HC2 domain-containing protein [Actinomycetota bacterium]